jgi:hypothetical protein
MMTAINTSPEFARFKRLPATRARYKKVLAVVLFIIALFGARAFAQEKYLGTSFFPLRTESLLGFYLVNLKAASITFKTTGNTDQNRIFALASSSFCGPKVLSLLDWKSDQCLSCTSPLESWRLDLFAHIGRDRFSKFEPGVGNYFENDTVGRSRISGAGLEENRWFFFKFKFKF